MCKVKNFTPILLKKEGENVLKMKSKVLANFFGELILSILYKDISYIQIKFLILMLWLFTGFQQLSTGL